MECWTNSNRRTCKNDEDGKSNKSDKQTDDFLETFPNFITLTQEERHEFFQTLYAAKVKLEKSGVTVKPYFGTIHDKSWNNSDALDNKKQNSTDNDVSISSGVESPTLQSTSPKNFKNNISLGRVDPVGVRNTLVLENLGKKLKEEKLYIALSQENLEFDSKANKSLENLNLEEKEMRVKMLNEVNKNNSSKSAENSCITPSLSRKGLNCHDSMGKRSVYHKEKEMLRIKGQNLKVQVTLTSGDNERMKRTLSKTKTLQINDRVIDNDEQNSGISLGVFSSQKDEDLECEKANPFNERIDDPEVEDLLNVEEENEEKDKEKSRPAIMRKKSFDEGKTKEKETESENRKNVLAKAKVEKEEISENLPQDNLLLKKEMQLENAAVEDKKVKTFQKSNSTVPDGEEKTEANIKEQNDSVTQRSNSNSSTLKEGSLEFKKDTTATQQRVMAVTSVKEAGSKASLEIQETEVASKKHKKRLERQQRVEKLQKYLQKEEGFYPLKVKVKNLKKEEEGKSPDSKEKVLNGREAISEFNSGAVGSKMIKNEEAETSSTSERKTIAIPCATKETEEVQNNRKEADVDSIKVPCPAPIEESTEEEKVTQVSELEKETFEECVPPFKPGKVVFVDDNVIEKIRNVILDLEKKAKAYNCDPESEYLILVVEYVEYLSTVMATLFEERILNLTNPNSNPNVRFDEENLAEIQQRLRVSTPTSDEEFQSDEELRTKKKVKRNKHRKVSFFRRLRKLFNCGKKKKRKKTANVRGDSSAVILKR